MKQTLLGFLSLVLVACNGSVAVTPPGADSGSSTGTTTASTTTSGSGGEGGDTSSTSTATSSSTTGTGGEGGALSFLPLDFVMGLPPNEPKIVIGGVEEWQSYGNYVVFNPNGNQLTVVSVTLKQTDPNGDAADFVKVGVSTGPNVLGSGTLDLNTQTVTLDLSGSPLIVPANSSTTILEMLGKMAYVQPSVTCPQGHGCARSGHTPTLAVTGVTIAEGSIEIQVTNNPPVRVLRKGEPIVTQLPLANSQLTSGVDQDFFKFQVCANVGPFPQLPASIAFKGWTNSFAIQGAVGVDSIHLRKGVVEMAEANYHLVTFGMSNPIGSNIPAGISNGTIGIDVVDEETIAGCEVYTLHGVMTVQSPTATLAVGFAPSSSGIITATLAFSPYGTYGLTNVQNLNNPNDPGAYIHAGFLWSDESEMPHESMSGSMLFQHGGSADWTSDYLVQGLGFLQVLSN